MNHFSVVTAILCLVLAGTANAATFTVNRTDVDAVDANPGDGICSIDALDPVPQCTLRAAIMEANELDGHDTILVPPGELIDLTLAGDGGDEVGDLLIEDDVDILGFVGAPPASAAMLPVIEAAPLGDRIFRVASGVEVLLRGLRLQGGNASSFDLNGGAVRSFGTLDIEHSIFTFNQANLGGAVHSVGPTSHVRIVDSHFESNRIAAANGTAVWVTIGSGEILRSSFRDNRGASTVSATIYSSSTLTIENSTLDGTPLAPPIAGLDAAIGVLVSQPQDLQLRNSTITGFSQHALRMINLDAGVHVRVAHTLLAGGVSACSGVGADPGAADVVISRSMVQSQSGCATFFSAVVTAFPQIGAFTQDSGSVTWFRPPTGPFSNVVNAGIVEGVAPEEPELGCTSVDQRGNPRPMDGTASGTPRCDLGAVEQEEPLAFIVDHFDEDLIDTNPGNGVCDIDTLVPGATCTLRAAVMEANALPGLQVIRFVEGEHTALLDRPAAASASGGDLDIDEVLVIEGQLVNGVPVTSIEQTVAGERVLDFGIVTERPVSLRQLRLTGGSSDAGGAVRVDGGASVLVERSELDGNHASFGGGAAVVLNGSLFVIDSDLHGNTADEFGAAMGVGSDGIAVVSGSSVWNNTNFDIPDNGVFESIYVANGGRLTLQSSTVTGNSAGIFADFPATFLVLQSTIADNAQRGILGLFDASTQNLSLVTSIVSGHPAAEPFAKGGPVLVDCQLINVGMVANVEHEYMLSLDGTCTGASATSFASDPLLGPLQRPSGRLSRVRMPAYDDGDVLPSPALDVAPDATCPRTDQRGQARPVDLNDVPDIDGSCDLGAVEVVPTRLFADGFEG